MELQPPGHCSWTAAASAAIVFGLFSLTSVAAGGEVANAFATLAIGDRTTYETDQGHVTFIFDGQDELGYRQRRFPGREAKGEAAETQWFDAKGRKIRRQFANGLVIDFPPHACFGIEGECIETAIYSDNRRKVTRWTQRIEDNLVHVRMEVEDNQGWKPLADGVYAVHPSRGTVLTGDWVDHVLGTTGWLRLISGPGRP